MKIRKIIVVMIAILLISVLMVGLTACSTENAAQKTKLVFADPGWDSVKFHNEVAGFIIEKGYGYQVDILPGSTATTFAGFRNGDIDIYMEVWTENLRDVYQEAIESGDVLEVSVNFDDNAQGLYVPTYLIKGDPEKGIEPLAPDLKMVTDLNKYWELFKDPEGPSKGRIYGSPPGWEVDKIMQTKVKTYGLDKHFNYFSPGSDMGLSASIAGAVEKNQPWLGYYWEPTWILGKYDMTLLEEEPYDPEKWENGFGCTTPHMPVTVCVYKDMETKAPEVVEFLKNYKTSSAITSNALAYMQQNDVKSREAALWFLKENEDLWTQWVPEDVAIKVKSALN